jgi:hypothetical protein
MTIGKDVTPEQEQRTPEQAQLDLHLGRLSKDSEMVFEESKKWAPVFCVHYKDSIRYPFLFPMTHSPLTLLCALTTHGAAAKNVLTLSGKKIAPKDIYKVFYDIGWSTDKAQRYGKAEMVFISEPVAKILTSAAKEADEANSPLIEPHHLLLAVALEHDVGWCCRFLRGYGLTYQLLKQTLSPSGEIVGDKVLAYKHNAKLPIQALKEQGLELTSQILHFDSLRDLAQSEGSKRREQACDVEEQISTKTNELDALQRMEESLAAHLP